MRRAACWWSRPGAEALPGGSGPGQKAPGFGLAGRVWFAQYGAARFASQTLRARRGSLTREGVMKLWIRCTALVALTAGAAAFVASTRPAAAARTSPERLASGERVYLTSCAMCHGPSGNGDGPLAEQLAKESGTHPARLNDAARLKQLGRAGVYRVIVEGGGHTQRSNLMPPWGEKLGPVLADDVTDYVMNFPNRGPSAPPSATSASRP